ncbi:MAG: uracil-DNA glycosylase [Candidatus Pacebacteria bacterium]|nr:uracil-DNA glycosylase [Candidatus Paceibacterota bacterium]
MNKTQLLNELKGEVEKCQRCPLHKTRVKIVFGTGSANTELMFISEAPGHWEDQKGEPFVGAAGKVLNKLLDSIGIKREKIYIANLLMCRPPQNRDPLPGEIRACVPYLEKQIEIIKPKVICPLGRHSMKFLMEKFNLKDKIQPIGKIHGQVFEIKNLFQKITIIPLYHPAVILYNPNMKKILEKDFQVIKQYSS